MEKATERPLMYILAYDPRKSVRYHTLYTFFAQTPNVVWLPADDVQHALNAFNQVHPAICYVNLGAPDCNLLLRNILNTNAPYKPELLLCGKPKGLENMLLAQILPQVRSALHVTQLPSCRKTGKNEPMLEEILLRARSNHLDELATHGTDAEILSFYKELEPNQKADLAISTLAHALKLEKELAQTPEEKHAEIERKINHKRNYVKRFMSEALDAPDKPGKETFKSFTSEGGGVSFPRIFVKYSSPERARHLADTYNFLHKECPVLRVPEPDKELNDYAVIDIGGSGAITVVSAEQVTGPTYRKLLRERNALLDKKNMPEDLEVESEFAQLLCDKLLQNAIHDLAVFHAATNNSKIGPSRPVTSDVSKTVVQMYLHRMSDLARDISTHLRIPEAETRISTLVQALKAFSPFDQYVPPGEGVVVTDSMFVANRDCSPANMALNVDDPTTRLYASENRSASKMDGNDADEPSPCVHALFQRVRRAVQRRLQNTDPFETVQGQQSVAKALDRIVREKTYHFDFGYRQNLPCLWGEDICELILDHDWRFDAGETERATREFTFESHAQQALYEYALNYLCASRDIEFASNDENTNDAALAAGKRSLKRIQNDGVLTLERGMFATLFSYEREVKETPACVDAQRSLARYGAHNPATLATHLDWMRYYRAVRGASHALARWREKDSTEPSMPIVRHYLHQSIAAINRLRTRFYGHAVEKGWMLKGDAQGDEPTNGLDCDEAFYLFDACEPSEAAILRLPPSKQDQTKAHYHMIRLNALAALSKRYCQLLRIDETPWEGRQ